jgi:hypothetical protein
MTGHRRPLGDGSVGRQVRPARQVGGRTPAISSPLVQRASVRRHRRILNSVIPVPFRPDVRDVIEPRVGGRCLNVLGLYHMLNQLLGFCFDFGCDVCQGRFPDRWSFCVPWIVSKARSRGVNCDVDMGRPRHHPSRRRHSARTEAVRAGLASGRVEGGVIRPAPSAEGGVIRLAPSAGTGQSGGRGSVRAGIGARLARSLALPDVSEVPARSIVLGQPDCHAPTSQREPSSASMP